MSEWILVLTLILVPENGAGFGQVETIGFRHEGTCVAAKEEYLKANDEAPLHISAVCVRR